LQAVAFRGVEVEGVVVARPLVLDLAAQAHALSEEVLADALERVEARGLHRDLLDGLGGLAPFLVLLGHLWQHRAVIGRAGAQEGHALLVDVRGLEAEHARVEVDHLRQVAAVDADVADLADADGMVAVAHWSSFLAGLTTVHRSIAQWAMLLRPFGTAILLLASAAIAQPSNRDVYMYQGPDRDKRLVEGAKKEGQVGLYSTMTVGDGKAVGSAFERKYGVRVVHWRTSSEKIVQRAVAEARGRRYEADVFESSSNHLEALRREGLLEDFTSPVLADIVP